MIFSRFSIDFLPLGNPINIDALRAATPLLLYSIEICYCSMEFGSLGVFFSAHRAAGRRRGAHQPQLPLRRPARRNHHEIFVFFVFFDVP